VKIRISLTAALAAIALLLTACGDPQVIVVEREVVATPTPAPVPTATSTPQPSPTSTPESSPTPTAQPTPTPSVTDFIDDSQAYVVRIDYDNGCASDVLLGNSGLVLTNYHVVRGANSLVVTS